MTSTDEVRASILQNGTWDKTKCPIDGGQLGQDGSCRACERRDAKVGRLMQLRWEAQDRRIAAAEAFEDLASIAESRGDLVRAAHHWTSAQALRSSHMLGSGRRDFPSLVHQPIGG